MSNGIYSYKNSILPECDLNLNLSWEYLIGPQSTCMLPSGPVWAPILHGDSQSSPSSTELRSKVCCVGVKATPWRQTFILCKEGRQKTWKAAARLSLSDWVSLFLSALIGVVNVHAVSLFLCIISRSAGRVKATESSLCNVSKQFIYLFLNVISKNERPFFCFREILVIIKTKCRKCSILDDLVSCSKDMWRLKWSMRISTRSLPKQQQ